MVSDKKKRSKRYDTSGMVEAQFEPGSDDQVLKNLLGIKIVEEMDQAEELALEDAQDTFIKTYGKDHRFTEYRRVNLAEDNFKFATAAHIPN